MRSIFTRLAPALLLAGVLLSACSSQPQESSQPAVDGPSSEPFGQTPEGISVQTYTLKNANGIELRATNYGGIITSLKTPEDRKSTRLNSSHVAISYAV